MLYPLSYEGRSAPWYLPAAWERLPDSILVMAPKVLVIDDDPVIVELLRVNFEIEGFEVLVAGDGPEGLRVAATGRPDVILSDIMRPRMDGLEVVSKLKSGAATKHIPVILLSATAQNAEVQLGLDAGADDYVTKPFDPFELIDRVNAVLAKARR